MANAARDENDVPTLIGVSSVDGVTPIKATVNPATGRLLVDLSSGGGTVTSVSVVTANGFAGTVATPTTTPAITLTTTLTTPVLAGNGTALIAATTIGSGAVVLATSPTLVTPALGTPSALVGTNITGTAAGLTAGTVTTNANLTGAITSVGNATSLGSFTSANLLGALTDETGTGAAVFANTPTLVTPILGAATATSLQSNTLTASTNNSINLNAGSYNTIQTYTPAPAGTATLDLSKGNIHHITMPAGNITIALSNGTAGQCFIVRILQDATGSRTVTWFTTIRWVGGSAPTLTTTASKADTLGFEVTGANTYDGYVVGQNI